MSIKPCSTCAVGYGLGGRTQCEVCRAEVMLGERDEQIAKLKQEIADRKESEAMTIDSNTRLFDENVRLRGLLDGWDDKIYKAMKAAP